MSEILLTFKRNSAGRFEYQLAVPNPQDTAQMRILGTVTTTLDKMIEREILARQKIKKQNAEGKKPRGRPRKVPEGA